MYPERVCALVPGGKAAPPGGVGECVFRLFAIHVTSLRGASERWLGMCEVAMAKAKAKVKGVDSAAMGEPVVVLVEMARGGRGPSECTAGEDACREAAQYQDEEEE